ncbi:MAG: stalk domain-containing protein [Bacillota bacterium]
MGFFKIINKSHLKGFVAGIVASAILIPTFSSAAGTLQKITASINTDIKITWNGAPFVPTEPDGTKLYPIVYNNRTYLPVRYIAEKAEVKVGWDSITKTVMLDNRLSKVISYSEAFDAVELGMTMDKVDFILGSPQRTEASKSFIRKDYRWQYDSTEVKGEDNDGYIIVTFINGEFSGKTSSGVSKEIEQKIEGLTTISSITSKLGKWYSLSEVQYVEEYYIWDYPDGDLKLTVKDNKVVDKKKI